MTIETMFFYVMCGIIFVLSGIAFYYLRLYRNKLFLVEKEYQNAKNIIRNIVITFKKRQEDHENKIEDILYNIEKLSSRIAWSGMDSDPPAMAGMMERLSPSFTGVSKFFMKRISSSFRKMLINRRTSPLSSHNPSLNWG